MKLINLAFFTLSILFNRITIYDAVKLIAPIQTTDNQYIFRPYPTYGIRQTLHAYIFSA